MIDLRTLGTLNVVSDGHVLQSVVAQPKRLALLIYLVLAAPRGFQRRDKLLSLFWPELDEKHARSSLSQALSYLRRSLGEGVVLTRGVEEVGVDREAIRCDVIALEDALGRGERQLAVSLYAGPFLDGFFLSDVPEFERWIETERSRLAQDYAQALEELAVERETLDDAAGAVEWWRRLAAHDPFSSRVALRLMQALSAAGETSAALQHGSAHQALLVEELAVEADPEIYALVERLRTTPPAPEGPRERPEFDVDSSRSASTGAEPDSIGIPAEDSAPAGSGPGSAESALEELAFLPQPAASYQRQRWAVLRLDRERRAGPAVLVLSALLVIASAAAGFVARSGSSTATTGPARIPVSLAGSTPDAVIDRSIAVLPFENLSASKENEYFTDGITDDILTNLSKIESLRVISRTSVMQYKGRRGSIPEIAGQLGVAYVLEGSVRRAGGRVRITAQLINARTDEHLWAEAYDRELRDIFEIQSEVARQIAHALRTSLSAEERARIAAARTENLEAYDFYLKGRDYLKPLESGAAPDERAVQNAITLFQHALARDPTYALAHAGLARAYFYRTYDHVAPSLVTAESRVRWDSAVVASKRAITLAPQLPDGYAALGSAYTSQGRFRDAIENLHRAVQLNPSHAEATAGLASSYYNSGRPDEAIRWGRRAVALEPLRGVSYDVLGDAYRALGLWMDAERMYRRWLELEPDAQEAHVSLVNLYARMGKQENAEGEIQSLRNLDPEGLSWRATAAEHALRQGDYEQAKRLLEPFAPGSPQQLRVNGQLVLVYWHLGEREKAEVLLKNAERKAHQWIAEGDEGERPYLQLMQVHAVRGDNDEALRWMQEWIRRGAASSYHFARLDPRLTSLRRDPRYHRLMEELGAEVERMRQRVVREGW